MRNLLELTKYREQNKKFFNVLNYYLSQKDFYTALNIINNYNKFTKDPHVGNKLNNLFILEPEANKYFGIGEIIVGSATNMVFSGNVNIRVDMKKAQPLVEQIIYDGMFIDTIKEAYKTACADRDGISYILMVTQPTYDTLSGVKVKDEFLGYEILKSFEVEQENNVLKRYIYKLTTYEDKTVEYKFVYTYTTEPDGKTNLLITGYDEKDNKLDDNVVRDVLKIDRLDDSWDFVPYERVYLGEGLLTNNTIFIESSLALNLYFQDEDIISAQTQTYAPENMMYRAIGEYEQSSRPDYFNKYQTKHVLKNPAVDQPMLFSVEGHSAIKDIERNIALLILEACLEAKISPVSTGYSLLDAIGNNTDVGILKERVSIRLRESHVNKLKITIARFLSKYLKMFGLNVDFTKIAVIFDPYITPSVESLTNVLSKQVQFGIKSRYQAIKDLNKNEMSDEEVELEYQRVLQTTTQQDYNVVQQEKKEKENQEKVEPKVNNVLKGTQVED